MVMIIVPVFDMGMSFGEVMSRKSPEKVWKRSGKTMEIYIQNCVRTLKLTFSLYCKSTVAAAMCSCEFC